MELRGSAMEVRLFAVEVWGFAVGNDLKTVGLWSLAVEKWLSAVKTKGPRLRQMRSR